MDAFISREQERAELTRLFDEGARVVTITGPAGMGKSRLASEWRPTDSLLVDLTEARTLDDIVRIFALELGADRAFGDAAAHVGRMLAARGEQCVIVDNFEHLVPLAEKTIGAWVKHASRARFLVTSRVRLHLRAETVLELGPLQLPEAGNELAAPAVELLMARASAVDAAFEVQPADVPVVAEIARTLEGLPLALELAAPRLVSLGAKELRSQLSERFASRGDEFDTLREAIQWSWDLMSDVERQAFTQCSAFQGGFRYDSAEEVIALPDGYMVLDILQSLHSKSLLRAAQQNRLGMYVSLREFAAERLENATEVYERHAAHFANLAQELGARLQGDDALESWTRLRRERENIVLAADRAKDDDLAARATLALEPLLSTTGPDPADEARFESAMKRCPTRAHALLKMRGVLRLEAGKATEAMTDLQEASRLANKAGDARCAASADRGIARLTMNGGGLSEALAIFRDNIIPRAQQHGERLEEGRAILGAGQCLMALGKTRDAEESYEDALAIFRAEGALKDEALTLGSLGVHLMNHAQPDEALLALSEAEAIQEQIGAAFHAAFTAGLRALALLLRGDTGSSVEHFEAALEIQLKMGATRFAADTMGYLGIATLLEASDLDKAQNRLSESVKLSQEVNYIPGVALFGAFAGAAAAMRDDGEQAEAHFQDAQKAGAQIDTKHLSLVHELLLVHTAGENGSSALQRATETPAGGRSPAKLDLDVALAVRTLNESALPGKGRRASSLHALVVDREKHRITPPGANSAIDLSTRVVLQHFLYGLLDARNEDKSLTRDELAAIAWPGEELPLRTRTNRVHVAVATLRKLGLTDVIVSVKGAYTIHPSIDVREVEP